MDELSVCFSALKRSSDFLRATLQNHFKTITINSDSELWAFLKTHHLFSLVMSTRLHNKSDMRLIRNLCAAMPRLPTVLYGQVGSEELAFQLAKTGVEHFIPEGNLDELLATLHHLKEQATFRIDLRDFGIDLSQSNDYWVRQFFDVLLKEHRYIHLTTVQQIANQLGITPVHLDRSFKKDGCPMTPKQILLCLKNYYAAYLLDTTSWSTQKIAQCCGFNSEHDLYKSFAKRTGITVKQFRKSKVWREYPQIITSQYKSS